MLFQQEANHSDLIRLDSQSSLSPVEEFDPLGSLRKEPVVKSNPTYSFHLPLRQTAEPQVRTSAGRGYAGLFDTGADPFSSLLAFTRSNLGPGEQARDPSPSKSAWTTFD